MSRRLGTRLNADKVWFDGLSVGFPASNATMSEAPKIKLAPLLPHFAKAIEMSRLFLELRRRHNAVLSALDHVDIPLLVVDAKRSVIVANQKAHHAIEEIPALQIGADGRLTSDDADLLVKLQSHTKEACVLVSDAPSIGKDQINLGPDGDESLLQLAIAPIRDRDHDLDGDEGLALLTIISPKFLPRSDLGLFARQHQLSTAETEVCRLIYEGLNVAQIADRRETTAATAKNQIASVLSKTNTRNRIDLIRTIINTQPPIL
ncbi:MAG: helix-turn-helix transcriptional regulator [Pseudomonadota bacterium]